MFSNVETRRVSLAAICILAALWIVVFSAARFGARSGARAAILDASRDRKKGILRLPTKP